MGKSQYSHDSQSFIQAAKPLTIDRILKLPEVMEATSCSRSSIYALMEAGDFPKSLRLGGCRSRSVGWRLSDIQNWINERAAEAGYEVEDAE